MSASHPALTPWRYTLSRPATVLVCIYLLSVTAHLYLLGGAYRFPHISSDEVQYIMTGENVRLGKGYKLRGEFNASLPPLFPLLIAAAHSIGPGPRASMFVIACLIMPAALFPVYCLARYAGAGLRACYLLAAAASVLPHTFYAATYMPETLQYPVFLAAFYAAVRWLDRQNRKADIALGGWLGALLLIKMQGAQLATAYLIAAVVVAWQLWRTQPARLGGFLRHAAAVIGVAAAMQVAWQIFKQTYGASALGIYGTVLSQQGLPHLNWRLVLAYCADFLLAPGLITAVPLFYWLRHNGNFPRTVLVTSALLIQMTSVAILDGGLTGWLRERLFLYSLPIAAVFAVLGVPILKSRQGSRAWLAMFAAPAALLAILMLYPFHVSPVIETPWANVLGSFDATGYRGFSRMRLAIVATGAAWAAAAILWRSSRNIAAEVCAVFVLGLYGMAWVVSSATLKRGAAAGLREARPIVAWLADGGVGQGGRLLVSGRHSFFEPAAPCGYDGFFLDWTWRLGLIEHLAWQIESLGRFDVRMIPAPQALLAHGVAGDFFLSATEFAGLELVSARHPFYLYRLPARPAATPRYVTRIPGEKFFTVVGRKTASGEIVGTGAGKGYLVYGPYLAMPSGSYRVNFEVSGDRHTPLIIEVAGNGEGTIARKTTTASNMPPLVFNTSAGTLLQYRVLGESHPQFRFASVRLEYFGPSAAVDTTPQPAGRAAFVPRPPLTRIRSLAPGSCFVDVLNGAAPAVTITLDRHAGLQMAGWVADVKNGHAAERVFVALYSVEDSFFAAAQRNERLDVAGAFRKPSLLRSGFLLSATTASIPAGTYRLKILQADGSQGGECDSQRSVQLK